MSEYYRLEVSASTDSNPGPADKKLLNDFDDWYTDYNIENITLVRMVAKNKKNNGVPTNQNNCTTANPSSATPTTLDPRLDPRIKTEPEEAAKDQKMNSGGRLE